MRALVFCAALLALGGCKSSAELASAKAAEDDGYCASIGAPPGSAAHTQCRLQIRSNETRLAAARVAARSREPSFQIVPPPMGNASPQTCTTRPFLDALQTKCN